jgi:hypothetical protein
MFALTKRSDKPHQARNCLYRRGRGVDLLLVVGPPGLDCAYGGEGEGKEGKRGGVNFLSSALTLLFIVLYLIFLRIISPMYMSM